MSKISNISLREALKTARADESLRTDAILAGREASTYRLEIMREHLSPVFKEIPVHIDIFDFQISAGDRPRLWLDMMSFIEFNAEKRSYGLFQDRPESRHALIETPDLDVMQRAVTDYVARRLVQRERLIHQDETLRLNKTIATTSELKTAPIEPLPVLEEVKLEQSPTPPVQKGSLLDQLSQAIEKEEATFKKPKNNKKAWGLVALLATIFSALGIYYAK